MLTTVSGTVGGQLRQVSLYNVNYLRQNLSQNFHAEMTVHPSKETGSRHIILTKACWHTKAGI